jgi:voltage-gated potassium channel
MVLTALAIVFLALLVIQYTVNLSPEWARRVDVAQFAIWGIFVINFVIRLALAPSKLEFLRHNWLTALATLLPALRAFRAIQVVMVLRSAQAAQAIPVAGRGLQALRRLVERFVPLYIGGLTAAVLFLSAAGMLSIERHADQPNITNFGDALWWSAATITTIGSELYPVTEEGRILAVLVMLYGLAFAGYIAATLVTTLIGRQPSGSGDVSALKDEIAELRAALEARGDTPARNAGQSEPEHDA